MLPGSCREDWDLGGPRGGREIPLLKVKPKRARPAAKEKEEKKRPIGNRKREIPVVSSSTTGTPKRLETLKGSQHSTARRCARRTTYQLPRDSPGYQLSTTSRRVIKASKVHPAVKAKQKDRTYQRAGRILFPRSLSKQGARKGSASKGGASSFADNRPTQWKKSREEVIMGNSREGHKPKRADFCNGRASGEQACLRDRFVQNQCLKRQGPGRRERKCQVIRVGKTEATRGARRRKGGGVWSAGYENDNPRCTQKGWQCCPGRLQKSSPPVLSRENMSHARHHNVGGRRIGKCSKPHTPKKKNMTKIKNSTFTQCMARLQDVPLESSFGAGKPWRTEKKNQAHEIPNKTN